MPVMRRGLSLVELVVTVALLGVVLAFVARTLIGQQRLYQSVHARETLDRASRQAVLILAGELEPVFAQGGDLTAGQATDSAVEFQSLVGAAIGCGVHSLDVRLPPAADTGAPTFAAYVTTPAVGDRLLVFDAEADPEQWRERVIVGLRTGGSSCAWAGPRDGYTLTLDSALTVAPLSAMRITRRTRYSLYRSGDNQWYLGMRDWNSATGRFNTIQPVSGPYLPYSARASTTGVKFTYVDSSDRLLPTPVANATGVRRVDVTIRTTSGGDSIVRLIALRHAQ
jgi:prepilin-type N-terminal cleavage/methylation domain-containing protein